MLLSQCTKDLNTGPLELELLENIKLTDNLTKLTFQDRDQKKVNMFIEGATCLRLFTPILPGTLLSLSNFYISVNFSQISQHFPTYIQGESVAIYQSDFDFIILISDPLPVLHFAYNGNTLDLTPDSPIDTLSLTSLYQARKVAAVTPEKQSPEKQPSLKTIHEKTTVGIRYASFYAIVVDCSGSYLPKAADATDHLVTLKITDPSIFPNHATVNIFHRNPKDFPKIANFGDIIKLQEVSIKDYSGGLQATIPCNGKGSCFFLFPYSGESLVPYISYRNNFHNSTEHSANIKRLSEWGLTTFSNEFPLFIKNTKRLVGACASEEIDLLTRILGIYSLGTQESDPKVCICGDNNEVSQLIIPEEKLKMLRYVEKGDVIRIRSVCYEDKVLYLNSYSEILRIPAEFKCMSVPAVFNSEELNKYSKMYGPVPVGRVISYIAEDYRYTPITPFQKVLQSAMGTVVKVEGFIVKINHGRGIDITLWDGEKEENLMMVHVDEENISEFANGKSWEDIRRDCVKYDRKFQAAVMISEKHLRLVSTKLIS